MKYIREIGTACYINRKLKTLFSYVFVFLFYILRHDIYFTMVVLLVEELGHVVLAAGNIQLGWVWSVITHMAKWLPPFGEAATRLFQALPNVVDDADVVPEQMGR